MYYVTIVAFFSLADDTDKPYHGDGLPQVWRTGSRRRLQRIKLFRDSSAVAQNGDPGKWRKKRTRTLNISFDTRVMRIRSAGKEPRVRFCAVVVWRLLLFVCYVRGGCLCTTQMQCTAEDKR